ncbi:MAG: NAD(P)-binding domain-containing protein, partial [bacterium]|nr:NAD(P)-binding domain-containing protein [bacterium]
MKRISDFAVIGLGCAGMGAYLQIKKESENIMLFERGRVGGDLYHANSVENLLFSKSLRGADACRLIKKQVEGEKIIRDNCLSVSEEKGFVTIKTERKEYVCRYAVVATGREQKKIGFSFGKQKHFSSEAKGNKICIIGGGERALDCAVSLIEKNKEVSVVSTGTFSKVNASLLRESSQAVFYTDSSVMDIAKAEKYIVKFEFGGEILNKEYDDIIISIGT